MSEHPIYGDPRCRVCLQLAGAYGYEALGQCARCATCGEPLYNHEAQHPHRRTLLGAVPGVVRDEACQAFVLPPLYAAVWALPEMIRIPIGVVDSHMRKPVPGDGYTRAITFPGLELDLFVALCRRIHALDPALARDVAVELADYEAFMSEAAKVYYELTDGKLSKVNTRAEHIIGAVREAQERDEKDAIADAGLDVVAWLKHVVQALNAALMPRVGDGKYRIVLKDGLTWEEALEALAQGFAEVPTAAAIAPTLDIETLTHEIAVLRPRRGDILVLYLPDDDEGLARRSRDGLRAGLGAAGFDGLAVVVLRNGARLERLTPEDLDRLGLRRK